MTDKRMVSRSLRLKTDTLKDLQKLADDHKMGITVFIRYVLEQYVETDKLIKQLTDSEGELQINE